MGWDAVSKPLRGHLLEEGIWLQRAELGAKVTGGGLVSLLCKAGTQSSPSALGTILTASVY